MAARNAMVSFGPLAGGTAPAPLVIGIWKGRTTIIDFMAALWLSAAFSEKEDGVLEGVALPRVVRDEAHLAAIFAGAPPERVSAEGGCHQ